MDAAGAGASVVLLLGLLVLAVLFALAPLKLYSIHRDIRRTNELLQREVELLAKGNRFQSDLLAQVSKNMTAKGQE